MKEIKLTQGYVTIVDDEDYDTLNQLKWYYNRGYARHDFRINGKKKCVYMHEYIMRPEEGYDVDHVNGDTLLNIKSNLRICTRTNNSRNAKKTSSKTSSKYKGVSWSKRDKKWEVYIHVCGNKINLGRFTDEIAGANAYNHYAKLYYGEFARLNECEVVEDWERFRFKRSC